MKKIKYPVTKKFSPETYDEYIREPQWVLDGFETYEDYESYYANVIAEWIQQSKKHTEKWKATCRKALQTIEYMEDASAAYTNIDQANARSPIAIAYASIQEQTALLSNNIAHPIMVATQESENLYVAASNQIMEAELEENDWDTLAMRAIYLADFYNVGYFKSLVDYQEYGPFGQLGKYCIEYVHPDNIYPDPRAKEFAWSHMDYIIEEHHFEIADIRQKWPVTGFKIPDDTESSMYTSMKDNQAEDTILSPIPKLAKGPSWKRQRIRVYECWFKDSRLKFVPQTEPEREEIDELGNVKTIYKPLVTDGDGNVVGDWLPAFPNGRCIVIAERRILEDMQNRLPHGSAPYTLVKLSPSDNPYISGDATRIIQVADKINYLLAEVMSYYHTEIQRPILAELGALANKESYKKITNKANKVLLLNPGRIGHIMRMPATDIPPIVLEIFKLWLQLLDLVAGSSSIMRGNLADGAQLSAEAMDSLQQQASQRVTMKAKQFNKSVKELGRQGFWLIRRTYDENIKMQVTLPDGSSAPFDWESDKAVFETGDEEEIRKLVSQEGHFIGIKAGTGQPNAQQARQQLAEHLYMINAIRRIDLLDSLEWPNRQEINKAKTEEFRSHIAAESLGRKLGLQIVKAEKGERAGPGAREKYD